VLSSLVLNFFYLLTDSFLHLQCYWRRMGCVLFLGICALYCKVYFSFSVLCFLFICCVRVFFFFLLGFFYFLFFYLFFHLVRAGIYLGSLFFVFLFYMLFFWSILFFSNHDFGYFLWSSIEVDRFRWFAWYYCALLGFICLLSGLILRGSLLFIRCLIWIGLVGCRSIVICLVLVGDLCFMGDCFRLCLLSGVRCMVSCGLVDLFCGCYLYGGVLGCVFGLLDEVLWCSRLGSLIFCCAFFLFFYWYWCLVSCVLIGVWWLLWLMLFVFLFKVFLYFFLLCVFVLLV